MLLESDQGPVAALAISARSSGGKWRVLWGLAAAIALVLGWAVSGVALEGGAAGVVPKVWPPCSTSGYCCHSCESRLNRN